MIKSSTEPNGFQTWSDVPVSTKEEVLAAKATLEFSAKTSLSEKIQRVFNGLMFAIVGAKLLTFIPPVAAGMSLLSSKAFGAISGASVLQIPAVAKVLAKAPKIIATLAFTLVIRKILAVAINFFIYHAALITLLSSKEKQEITDNERWETFETLNNHQFECRRIALNKSGVNYDAFAIEHQTTKGNGQWVVVAGGNGWVGESAVWFCVPKFIKLGFNVLYVNGPGVGRSSGYPTSYSIGAGQEAGLQFLENGVEAKKILLYGTSLGGGAQAEAVKSHEFRKNIDYMVWSDRSFDTVSNAASHMVTFLAKPLFFLLGIELDGVAGAKRLETLGITHIVTQNSQSVQKDGILPLDHKDLEDEKTDDVIPNKASLYLGLKKAGFQKSKRMRCYGGPKVKHNGDMSQIIESLVTKDIQAFLAQGAAGA